MINKHEATATVEINLDEYDKDLLIHLIVFCHDNDLTFNEGLVKLIKNFLNKQDEKQLPLL